MAGITDKHGEDIIVHNFTQSGTDEYGDPEFTESTVETKALIQLTRQPRDQGDQLGERPIVKPVMFVSDTVDVTDQLNDTRSTEITRKANSTRYEVISAFNEGNGYMKLDCEKR